MRRRRILTGLLLTLAAPLAAEAEQAGKMARIAILGATGPEGLPQWEGFRHGLRERGYIEGQNIAIDYRWAQGRFALLHDCRAAVPQLEVARCSGRSASPAR